MDEELINAEYSLLNEKNGEGVEGLGANIFHFYRYLVVTQSQILGAPSDNQTH